MRPQIPKLPLGSITLKQETPRTLRPLGNSLEKIDKDASFKISQNQDTNLDMTMNDKPETSPIRRPLFLRVTQHVNEQFEQKILTCNDIFCECRPPQFEYAQKMFATLTCCCGIGLNSCVFCYGCDRIDCPSVFCAGCCLTCTSPCLFGVFASLAIGWRMCK